MGCTGCRTPHASAAHRDEVLVGVVGCQRRVKSLADLRGEQSAGARLCSALARAARARAAAIWRSGEGGEGERARAWSCGG